MIIGLVFTVLFTGFLFFAGRRQKNVTDAEVRQSKLPKPFYQVGNCLQEWFFRKKKSTLTEQEMDKALLLSKEDQTVWRSRMWGIIYLVLLAGSFLTVIYGVKNGEAEKVISLKRPEFGETENVPMTVKGLSEQEEINIRISGKEPEEKEMEAVFDETFQWVLREALSENESYDAVSEDLELPERTPSGIGIEYTSSERSYISNHGVILHREIPEEGMKVTFRVRIFYKDMEKEYEMPLTLFPKKDNATETERFQRALISADQSNLTEEEIILPSEFEGKAITYEQSGTSPFMILFFTVILAMLCYLLFDEGKKNAYKQRNEELQNNYGTILMKLKLLLHAGLSIRSAWSRITHDYKKSYHRGLQKKQYAYEEMCITEREILSGKPEERAYLDFGRRCGSHAYLKLGNLLAQNVRQGISGLEKQLETEVSQAMTDRKNLAIRKGEIAGSKMVFPMVLLLGVVIVILVVPAFMAL